jgi:hypothetical protein
MSATPQKTSIPQVPIKTTMFDNIADPAGQPSGSQVNIGKLTRPWIYFFERVAKLGAVPGGGAQGPFERTILLKNTTIGDDIADHVTCYGPVPGVAHTAILVRGVLRKAITSDLTLRINNVSSGGTVVVGTFTIPLATAVDTVLEFTSFTTAALPDLSTFTWDVTASDGSKDAAGVASFTIIWQP